MRESDDLKIRRREQAREGWISTSKGIGNSESKETARPSIGDNQNHVVCLGRTFKPVKILRLGCQSNQGDIRTTEILFAFSGEGTKQLSDKGNGERAETRLAFRCGSRLSSGPRRQGRCLIDRDKIRSEANAGTFSSENKDACTKVTILASPKVKDTKLTKHSNRLKEPSLRHRMPFQAMNQRGKVKWTFKKTSLHLVPFTPPDALKSSLPYFLFRFLAVELRAIFCRPSRVFVSTPPFVNPRQARKLARI